MSTKAYYPITEIGAGKTRFFQNHDLSSKLHFTEIM